jgi:predicted nucleotidyltransferase
MTTLSRDLIDEIARRLVDELHPEQIILFGSHAWGTPTEDSDIDLVVIMPDDAGPPAEVDFRARTALWDLGIAKDILVMTRSRLNRYGRVVASLERKILDEGIILYGRCEA